MKWFHTRNPWPQKGDKIIVKLNGCKLPGFKYMYMEVREGEGFGEFDLWRYATKEEKKEIENEKKSNI